MSLPVVVALVAIAFGAGLGVDRLRLRSYREVNGWQGEEIEAQKLAWWRDDKNFVQTGEIPSVSPSLYDFDRPGSIPGDWP